MGSIGKALGGIVGSVGKAIGIGGDRPKVKTYADIDLQTEKKDSAKKRKALFETEGGVLGAEVDKVTTPERGKIFS